MEQEDLVRKVIADPKSSPATRLRAEKELTRLGATVSLPRPHKRERRSPEEVARARAFLANLEAEVERACNEKHDRN
jgi:hypothetical protein